MGNWAPGHYSNVIMQRVYFGANKIKTQKGKFLDFPSRITSYPMEIRDLRVSEPKTESESEMVEMANRLLNRSNMMASRVYYFI